MSRIRLASYSISLTCRAYRPIPYLLITNGGGYPDDDRRRMLSSELGQEVRSTGPGTRYDTC